MHMKIYRTVEKQTAHIISNTKQKHNYKKYYDAQENLQDCWKTNCSDSIKQKHAYTVNPSKLQFLHMNY